jgi:stress response protein SCP2
MNTQTHLVIKLIQKRLVVPVPAGAGDSRVIARQLDSVLMDNGFKLSSKLLKAIGGASFESAIEVSNVILTAVKGLVGAHVKHNTYFKDFPKNVPDTLEFWGGLLAQHFEETGELTTNLLDFATYGTYQHIYEDMLAGHDTWRGKTKLKVLNLGGSLRQELEALYVDLAGSKIPLNEDDRKLIAALYIDYEVTDIKIAVRENKAIINALRLTKGGQPLDVDTPVDVLRLAAYLSGGDVTLLENTKFKSFSRPIRRQLLAALNGVADKVDDINRYRERFKRLARSLHPREFKFAGAIALFDFAGGNSDHITWGSKVHDAVSNGRVTKAVNLLVDKPGYFVRSIDKLARDATDIQFTKVTAGLKDTVGRVSGRVLLSLAEHLDNRASKPASRIFVNRAGKGYVTENKVDTLSPKRIKTLSNVIWKEIEKRVPAVETLVINDDISTVAVPLSDKTKSEGFRVLPRGSVLPLDNTQDILRFFIYWHQTSERTDYDLSVAMFDEDFEFKGQVSFTHLRTGAITHSGDITDATNGATEFIDVRLNQLSSDIVYLLPTINAYSGEPFATCKEAFMGFMMRKESNRGAPFEAKSVQTKFALRGDKNGVGVPMVFMKGENGWQAKWLDIYSKGMPWGNRVEQNRFSTALLAQTMIARQYLTMGRLTDLYRKKAKKTYSVDKAPARDVTYIGLDRPEKLTGTFYTLDNLKTLIPA